MKLTKSKKGFQLSDVPVLAVTLGVIAIVLGLMATITGQVAKTGCTYGYSETTGLCLNSTGGTGGNLGRTAAFNITYTGQQAVNTFSGWQSTWVVVIGASVIIGIVGAYLYFRPK